MSAGRDPITKRYVKLTETCATEGEAIAARERMLAQVEAGSHPDRAATVAVLMERWMEVVDHELSTSETTAGYVRRTINPALGEWTLRTPKPHDCGKAKRGPHQRKPMAPATIRRIHAILSSALNYAISRGWIEKNPATYAHPPKLSRRRARPAAPEKVAQPLNAASERDVELGIFLWLAVTTGARRGEVTALRWPSVDFDSRVLIFSENYAVRAGQRRLKGTKTDTDRTLSMDPETVQILRDFRAARATVLVPVGLELPEEAFVFSPVPLCDRPWHPDHFTHAYREVADSLGIPEPLKNLRHFNATQLLAAGVDLRTTAGRLGHSDGGATTLRVYANWTRPADQRAADQLAGDLLALRRKAASGETATAAGPQLARVAKPISDVLPPALKAATYLDIAAALREAVSASSLEPGDLVPTVTDLAAWFHVARSTAQRAVTALGTEGLTVRRGPRWVVAELVERPPAVGE